MHMDPVSDLKNNFFDQTDSSVPVNTTVSSQDTSSSAAASGSTAATALAQSTTASMTTSTHEKTIPSNLIDPG